MAGERLLRAVLSFYREETEDLARLEPLLSCRLSRGWSALRIDCSDRLHLEQINELVPLLRAPLASFLVAPEETRGPGER